MILRSRQGNVLITDIPFAKGGEGGVYHILGCQNSVAKIYHPFIRTKERERKILAMLASPPRGEVAVQIAWPTDILYDCNEIFVGFIMPQVINTTKIDSLYSYDRRNENDYRFYIQVAQNLCAVVSAVHSSGHLIGDLNPSNICVDEKTALVTLVDTDSYHIRTTKGNWFRCSVCRSEYVPTELHCLMDLGHNLRTTDAETFTLETDYFALAVNIFALLMNGCHPYACSVVSEVSTTDFTIVKNIKNGFFPFLKENNLISTLKYVPSMNALPITLQNLIVMAFSAQKYPSPKSRPAPYVWHMALGELLNQLVFCPINAKHQYYKEASCCPFCASDSALEDFSNKKASLIITSKNNQLPSKTKQSISWYFGILTGLLLWFVWIIGFIYLLLLIRISLWWVFTMRFLIIGLSGYVPLWIAASINKILPLTKTTFGKGIADLLNISRIVSFVFFIICSAIFTWGNFTYFMISLPLICIPVLLIHMLFPKYTEDLIS